MPDALDKIVLCNYEGGGIAMISSPTFLTRWSLRGSARGGDEAIFR